MKTVLLSLVVLVGVTGPALAQTVVSLSKPDAELPEPLTSPRSVRELPSGRVLISDTREKIVQLVDFIAGSATRVGREGQGPGEYALPGTLYAMPNGTTWLHDLLGRRYLKLDPTGKPTETVSVPGSSGGLGFIGGNGGGSDAKGRIFFEAPPFNLGSPDGEAPDSLAIMRWEPGEQGMDTVAWLRQPKGSVSATGGGGRFQVRIGGGKVFTPQERWGVAADGSIARVVPNPYQVIWYDPTGKAVAGPVIPYQPLKVTEADKQAVIAARKKAKPMMISIGDRGGRAPAGGPIEVPPPEFQETKPPFAGDGANQSVLVTPEGEVWVARTRPASDVVPTYDVFGRTGKLTGRVVLNPSSQVIGFGKGTVYVIRTDEDDLQYLQRFKR